MIVVFDSDIWQSDLYKGSGASAAVRFFIRQGSMRVAVPEVVRLEVENHLRLDLSNWIKDIESAHRQLLAVFGTLKEVVLPTGIQIEEIVNGATSSLGVDTFEVPFSLESARGAFLKVIRKDSPFAKGQQFKDAVIWHDCLQLASQDSVTFVTHDKAFYQDRRYEMGLASSLRDEAASLLHSLTVLSGLTDLLKRIKIDRDPIPSESMEQLQRQLLEMAAGLLDANGFAYETTIEAKKELFATEQVSMLFVKFTFRFGCVDTREDGRTSATIEATGDVVYDSDSKEFQKVRTPQITLSYHLADGTYEEKRSIYMSAHGVIGHRDVSHTVQYLLP